MGSLESSESVLRVNHVNAAVYMCKPELLMVVRIQTFALLVHLQGWKSNA